MVCLKWLKTRLINLTTFSVNSSMPQSLHSILQSRYKPKLPLSLRENLSLKEQRTEYKLQFGKRRTSVAYQVDGNIITEGNRCDYLVLAKQTENPGENSWKAIFVELKATDVEHALKQLDASMSNAILSHESISERHARIIAKSFPSNKSIPSFEMAKRRFKSKHNCSLKQITSGCPDLIS